MKTYKIFKDPLGSVQAIKDGWSWPAFFFGALWALYHRMWWVGLGFLGVVTLIVFAEDAIGTEAASGVINVFSLIVSVGFGIGGNALRVGQQIRKGYEEIAVVQAANVEMALIQGRATAATKPGMR
ncbi:DUF2628 domain-containing protein [Variovorax sp. 38R]|uniref:DUF2628 domain-containing protein n=1 Tax=Variovorax sp. 38R TaxID=2774875 RepID=UPI00177F0488|nr:DUF2628 domain-containing protein [Variovorax sp. 38R]QOF79133.1 DUF2628 domain-containing protein [Variovorax sp. 38R]